jgi:hypothetical protein
MHIKSNNQLMGVSDKYYILETIKVRIHDEITISF